MASVASGGGEGLTAAWGLTVSAAKRHHKAASAPWHVACSMHTERLGGTRVSQHPRLPTADARVGCLGPAHRTGESPTHSRPRDAATPRLSAAHRDRHAYALLQPPHRGAEEEVRGR